jgi:hypothetical protein
MTNVEEAELRRIIEDEVKKYLSELSLQISKPSGAKRMPLILLLLDSVYAPVDELFSQLRAISGIYRLAVLATEEFLGRYTEDYLRVYFAMEGVYVGDDAEMYFGEEIGNAELILAPVLGRDTIVKTALGVSDSLGSLVLLKGLLAGRRVIAIGEYALNEVEKGKGKLAQSGASSLANILHHYIERLRQWGVTFIKTEELFKRVEEELAKKNEVAFKISGERLPLKRQIVTVEDLQEAKRMGKGKFRIKENAIVTDEARDYAVREGIELERE